MLIIIPDSSLEKGNVQMTWNNDNGSGPWGGGGKSGRSGGAPKPPDIEKLFGDGKDRFEKMLKGGGSRGYLFIALVALALYAATGFYRVGTDEQGVVLRFGEVVRVTQPGLHYHLPSPIEKVERPKVTRENRIEVGFRTNDSSYGEGKPTEIREESQMLTGDENIILMPFSVLWRIREAEKYLFNVRDPEETIKAAAESVVRSIIGQTNIQQAFTEGRGLIQTTALTNLQKILDSYDSGIEVKDIKLQKASLPDTVVESVVDVQRAKADQERLRNEAEAYQNDIIPKARGESEMKIQHAQGYKEETINKAKGDTLRFNQLYEAYKLDKNVTKERLYLDMVEAVLGKNKKVIFDSTKGVQGVLPYLPLNEMKRSAQRSTTQGEG